MKHFILFAILTTILSGTAMGKSTAKGEVETDCPWAKQDERNGDISGKLKAINNVQLKKKKVGIQ